MHSIIVGLAQINVTVGAVEANGDRVARAAVEAAARGADVVAVPELAIAGYPPEDLVLQRHFVADCERRMRRLAGELPAGIVAVVGGPRRAAECVYNSAWVLCNGRVAGIYDKMLLPNYGVFDEKRLFASGARPAVLEVGSVRLGLHICEDSWDRAAAPCAGLRGAVDGILNISGSPYHRGKTRLRERVLAAASRAIGAPLLYCNLVGGQDELVFDGGSLAVDGERRLANARAFTEDLLLVRVRARPDARRAATGAARIVCPAPPVRRALPAVRARRTPRLPDTAEVYAALTLGLRDYVEKNRFPGVIVALSGGIDSALAAVLAADALGPRRVYGITLPSRFSSEGTRRDAHRVARALGIRMAERSIERVYRAFLEELVPLWPGRAPDVAEENLQARIRGTIVMALSNKFGWMVVTTGNKSETATGYCTLYGDMAGGFAVLKDVPKTLVYRLARWRNRVAGRALIPRSTLRRAPTAELRANQTDQDTLPPYPVLDGIIERYVEQDQSAADIVAAGFDPDTVRRVLRMIDANEYKRRQSAPGVKITPKAFGRDRRMPIVNAYRNGSRAP